MDEREEILLFWFGPLNADGCADAAHAQRWWTKDAAADAEIARRFQAVHQAIASGGRKDWLESPRGALAYVIVLDQFSRNMYRGSARAFEGDALALRAAIAATERGWDRKLAFDERGFLYMPFMHSEESEKQERGVQLFGALRDELSGPLRERAAFSLAYAQKHRDIVRRFGRFPHRNAALGRESTPEEAEFLTQPGSSF